MTMSSDSVPIVLDFEMLNLGEQSYITWSPERHPMFLVVGSTGSGKSYFISLLMGKISLHIPDSQLYLLDFKDIDFRSFADCERRFSYEDCTEGLTAFYESFQARLNGKDFSTNRKFLIFDEWAAYVMSRPDKKEQEKIKGILSTLLMMGRGVQHNLVVGLQRADSAHFPNGGRDNFTAILGMGNLSREQRLMLFPDFRENMDGNNSRGKGYLHLDGDTVRRIYVPSVTDFDKLNKAIREGLTR